MAAESVLTSISLSLAATLDQSNLCMVNAMWQVAISIGSTAAGRGGETGSPPMSAVICSSLVKNKAPDSHDFITIYHEQWIFRNGTVMISKNNAKDGSYRFAMQEIGFQDMGFHRFFTGSPLMNDASKVNGEGDRMIQGRRRHDCIH